MRLGRAESLWIVCLIVALACSLALPARAEGDAKSLVIRVMGEPLWLKPGDPIPFEAGGSLMVPMRTALEAFGATVLWDARDQSITAVTDDHRLTVWLDQRKAVVDGQSLLLDRPPAMVQGRTMLPLRFLAESFGGTMEWSREAWVYLPNDPAPLSPVPGPVLVAGPSPRSLAVAGRAAETLLIPMGPLVRAMGGESVWDAVKQAETATLGQTRLQLFRGQRLALQAVTTTAAPQELDLGIAPRLGDQTLLVSLKALVGALGGRIELWDGEMVVAPPLLLQVNGERLPPPVISHNGVVMAEPKAVLAALGAPHAAQYDGMLPLQTLVEQAGGSIGWVGNEAIVAGPITVEVRLGDERFPLSVPAALGENAAVMVPAAALADALHLRYTESSAEQAVTLHSGSQWVTVYASKRTAVRSMGPAWSESQEFQAGASPVWHEAKLAVPLQDLVESLGMGYRWESHTATATITVAATLPFPGWPARSSTGYRSDDLFGNRIHPIYRAERFHDGMDVSLPEGTPVLAVAPGRVILAGADGNYGLTIQVAHGGGVVTQYSHLSRFAVDEGEWVGTGECLGHAGSTGLATGPHLHFMVLVDGTPVDPEAWLP